MHDRCIVVVVVVQLVDKDTDVAVVRCLSLQHGTTVDQWHCIH